MQSSHPERNVNPELLNSKVSADVTQELGYGQLIF